MAKYFVFYDTVSKELGYAVDPDINLTKVGGTALTGRDISLDLKVLSDDSVKGLLRSIGDAGTTPANAAGSTILKLLTLIKDTDGIKKITNSVTVVATDLDIRNLVKTSDEIYGVLRTDAGIAYDARQIRALTAGDVVTIQEPLSVDDGAGSLTVDGTVTVQQPTPSSHKVEIHQPTSKETFQVVTSSADNIVVDKLTQTAYKERRLTISNDAGTTASFGGTNNNYNGKFFPRGCRGFLETVYIYVKNPSGGALVWTVYIAPYPGAAPVLGPYSITVPAGSSAAWFSVNVREPWPFDGCFPYILQPADEPCD